ncbi:MAG: helix-turn-helix transcriptional regulator [Alphaproteobacteria bacterium]|nr:helix-turn-helix transcriptional regulator [Alphaproteobacteria bacterium]MCW5742023.1 helix-turn-helix transcriptional regulator [Alphaproteobacteria bacterium]
MDEPTFSRILDAVYDAATAFERWPVALDSLGQAFGCSYVGLIDRNLRTNQGRASAVGIDQPGQREYFEVWSQHDMLRRWTRAYRPGAVETDRQILPRDDLVRSDYYNCFLKPRDMHVVMRITLAAEDGFRKFISFTRPASLGEYDKADVEQCHRLMPHLQRAARVAQCVEESSLSLAAFSDVFEQSAKGVLLLDRSGRVAFANRAARAMTQASSTLILRRERLEAASRDDNVALQRLIAGATGMADRPEATRGGVMRLAAMSDAPGPSVAVAPLAGMASWSGRSPVAFVLISDPRADSRRPEAMLRQLFGLTAAETRVAERLMLGDSPEQVAGTLDVSITTVRWHLSALYRKTGTGRQADLVRLLLSMPTV